MTTTTTTTTTMAAALSVALLSRLALAAASFSWSWSWSWSWSSMAAAGAALDMGAAFCTRGSTSVPLRAASSASAAYPFGRCHHHHHHHRRRCAWSWSSPRPTFPSSTRRARPSITRLHSEHNPPTDSESNSQPEETAARSESTKKRTTTSLFSDRPGLGGQTFDLTTALFCGALAFDAYAEPAANSTRWERGSRGMNVAFLSPAYTRNVYKALVQIMPLRCVDLPDEEDTAEAVMTGGGVDAYLAVGVVEGQWAEDVRLLESERHHAGVRDLRGCAHVGRSNTAWSNVDERKAESRMKKGESGAYHIPSSWGKGGQAVWEKDPPFYLYVQDPSEARLVFTVIDDDLLGEGDVVGSATKRLVDLIPAAKEKDTVAMMKTAVLAKIQRGEIDVTNGLDLAKGVVQEWEGDVKLTHKPKKKDKNGQIATAAIAGAAVAGPMGAAVGGLMASMYEGEVRGRISLKLRYLPIPQVDVAREKYRPKGGLPGVNWSDLYERHIQEIRSSLSPDAPGPRLEADDLEFCFFVNHDETGCACAVYRSLEKRLVAISFRGTCVPKDLVTDASIVQDAWVEGEDVKDDNVAKVHAGFRKSLNSIVRRLKELVLAAVAPGEDLSQYDVLVTGHSLGAALATLFTADIAEYGMDAGRSLPQLEPSEPWWNSLASAFTGGRRLSAMSPPPPPRPRSLKMYNFGSPRVGNEAFVAKFQSLMDDGKIDEAYRIVNGEDIVARGPRSMNGGFLGRISYEHAAPTVLINPPKKEGKEKDEMQSVLWIEGESSDDDCPVRDGVALTSPLAEGNLLGDLVRTVQEAANPQSIGGVGGGGGGGGSTFDVSKLGAIAQKVGGRLQSLKADDLPTILGIDKKYTEREVRIIQSIFSGEALNHHMEDEYYKGMGLAVGYIALVGEELRPIEGLGDAVVIDMMEQLERGSRVESVEESVEHDVESYDKVLNKLKEEEAV